MRFCRAEKRIKNHAGRFLLPAGLMLSLMFATPAYAVWQNEAAGPGAAVWVGEQQPDGNLSEQPAPGGASQYEAPGDHSATYIDGKLVSLTAPDGEKIALSDLPQTAPDGSSAENGAETREGAGAENGAQTAESEKTAGGSETAAGTQQPASDGSGQESVESALETEAQQPASNEAAQPETGSGEAADAAGLIASGGRLLDPKKPMVALTYDDGPYAPVGNRIMDVLETHNGRATFFMVGDRVQSYASEVRRMVTNGHEVANHTYNHKYLNKLDAASVRSQVAKANDVIEAVSGKRPSLMRLPGGLKNATVLSNVQMPVILWNIDTRDWEMKNAQKTIDAVVGKVKDGDIVLMHELYSSTADATAAIVPKLTEQGFQLVTVSELARFKGKTLANGQVYYAVR